MRADSTPPGRNINRREFVQAAVAAALAVPGCTSPTEGFVARARLGARPHGPTSSMATGLQPLNLGWHRDGFLYVPSTYDPSTPAPLLIMAHGGGRSSAEFLSLPWPALVDDLGIIIAAPDSRAETWDVIRHGRLGLDVDFIDRVLDWVFDHCLVDATRLGMGGFSDGATFALSLGITNGDLFTRLVAHAPGFIRHSGQFGLPDMYVSHGTSDDVFPVSTVRQQVQTLQAEGYGVTYVEFDGGHTLSEARLRASLEWFAA